MVTAEQIAALKAARPNLPDSKVDFALSLIAQFEKGKKPLSEKQAEWVVKLANWNAEKPKAETIKVAASMTSVIALFSTAVGNGLQKPSIRLSLPTGQAVKLSLAPKAGKNAGHVYVKVDGEYRGKIAPAGDFTPYQLDGEAKSTVVGVLNALGSDPAGVALAYGKATGECCFCGKDLTDDRSVEAGYGPTCAERYGLPWGADA